MTVELLQTKLQRPRVTRHLVPRPRLSERLDQGAQGPLTLVCAAAINLLAKVGFAKIYNTIDGFEGDTVDDPESVYHGKRMKNGWKNSAPWTYTLDPAKVWIPTGEELATLRATLDV